MLTQTHETFERPDEIGGSSDRVFGIVFTVVLAIIGVWPWLLETGEPRIWALGAAVLVLFVAIALPRLLAPANRLWTRFGLLLHKIVNPVVMGLIFYLTVTPTGLLMRALGKDPLRLKRDTVSSSYWIVREPPGPDPKSMVDQF